ncbi:MAG: hypothetical protein P8Y71_17995 [Pseudolabrys sp.]|jgi:hypothetical protein
MDAKRKIGPKQRDKAKKGGGPRTAVGKRHSRLNAFKHGLSVPIATDRHPDKSVLDLAHFIAGEAANDAILEQALIVAECEVTLQRIRQARVTAIDSAMACQDKDKREIVHETAEAFAKALPILCKIERYERRTQARRKRALQSLETVQVMARLNH